MFCGKAANKELNRSHKRALRILRNDYSSPFEELLRKSNKCTIHIKNLKKLMLEVYKCLKNENPSFMWNMFHEKSIQYNLQSKNLLMLPQTILFYLCAMSLDVGDYVSPISSFL